jgi:23S rRNA C2498 (ribose-2'-O)-methylase RlmM
MQPQSAFPHRQAYCHGCGNRYATLAILAQHYCKDAPSYIAREAFTALSAFLPKNESQARLLLSMWARRVELTEEDVRYVVTEVMK